MSMENEGVRAAAAFEYQDGALLAIRVEVENATTEQFDFGPADVLFTTCAGEAVQSCYAAQPVVDPEEVLADLDRAASREQASNDSAMVVAAPLVLLSALADVAAIGTGRADRADLTERSLDDMHRLDTQHHNAQQSLGQARVRWRDIAVRRTTLFPNRGVAGLVYLPVDDKAKFVRLYLRRPTKRWFKFTFRQTITPVSAG